VADVRFSGDIRVVVIAAGYPRATSESARGALRWIGADIRART